MPYRKKSRPRGRGDSQRTGARAYPLFVLDEIRISKLEHQIGVYIEENFLFESAFEKDRRSKNDERL